jgi:penicillin-binding protein 1A
MKPFVYATAIEKGYEPCTPIVYLPPKCGGNDASWNPDGSGKFKDGDVVPMQAGLWASDNRVTANLMCNGMVTPQELVAFARRLEVESPLDAVPALCLGVSDISLYEMVGAYTAFANLGTYSKPYFISRIEDKDGHVLATFGEQHKEAMSEKNAYTITEMMKGVINHGTGAAIRSRYGLRMPMAGKTGTTQNNADAWFMGFTPDIVVGSWVGFEQPSVHFRSNSSGAGATAALPIVANFYHKSYNDRVLQMKSNDFALPSDTTFTINFDCSVDTSKKKLEPTTHGF